MHFTVVTPQNYSIFGQGLREKVGKKGAGQCLPKVCSRFAFPSARYPRNQGMSLFGKIFSEYSFLRGHLTCTNKRAQADEQKIARNEGFLAPPAMHLLCMCSKLVPRCVSPFAKTVRAKIAFLRFPWNLLHVREREKVAETFRQCTFSFDNLLFF